VPTPAGVRQSGELPAIPAKIAARPRSAARFA
jgi:hypothetical protein